MRLTPSQYAKTLVALSAEGSDVGRVASSFLAFLKKNRAGKKLPTIIRISEQMLDDQAGRCELSIETAREADRAAKASIESAAARTFSGKELSFRYATNPNVLGGVRISSRDEMADATIRRRLNELEKMLR